MVLSGRHGEGGQVGGMDRASPGRGGVHGESAVTTEDVEDVSVGGVVAHERPI